MLRNVPNRAVCFVLGLLAAEAKIIEARRVKLRQSVPLAGEAKIVCKAKEGGAGGGAGMVEDMCHCFDFLKRGGVCISMLDIWGRCSY